MPARAFGDPIPDRPGFVAQCNAHDGMAVEDGIATPVQGRGRFLKFAMIAPVADLDLSSMHSTRVICRAAISRALSMNSRSFDCKPKAPQI
ncbi:MAG: hypothetical protein OXD42_13355 [Rhodospirillaceae bacterium]|nr:hypothetical protein [Rhodospirillaceae bacterium]